jgi:hypothetical protein
VTEATPPQRRWRAACPNCGAAVEFASAASASAVCSYCRSTLLREGDSLSQIGQSAEVFEDYSPLQLGSSGRWMGKGFLVVGRLQLAADGGNWNEWHLLFDPDSERPRTAWLSEDNGSFVLSLEAPLQEPLPPPEQLQIGAALSLAGQRWQVASRVSAELRAAQGELPRPPKLRERWPVVELRNANGEVGSLEYSQAQGPIWSVGRAVALADLALQGLRTTATGESVSEAGFKSRAFACPNCGAPLEPKLQTTKSLSCHQCQAVVDVPEGDAKALGFIAQDQARPPQIPLGRSGRLSIDGKSPPQAWQVVGYQERCDLPEDAEDEQSFWREYLLFNQMGGFAFLVDTREGWSLVKPLTGAPTPGRAGAMVWQGRNYALRWNYGAKVTHVLGEFYWPVRLDQVARVGDYLAPDGHLLSREATADEVVWSEGRPLPAAEVQQAFGLGADQAAALARDASAFKGGSSLIRNILIALLILLVVGALLRACSRDSCQGFKDSYGENSLEYQQCRANARGSGSAYSGSTWGSGSGGSYGGYSSGGGGHK